MNSALTLNIEHIREWVPEQTRKRVNIAKALDIIRREFCTRVYTRGVCPQDCLVCRREIIDLFRLEQAKKPEALLTWLAKDHSARWIEKLILAEDASEFLSPETPEQEYDRLFMRGRGEQNPVEELRQQYHESPSSLGRE